MTFELPEFLKNRGTDDNHKLMLEIMPDDIDMSQGNDLWNLTRGSALLGAEICQFVLPEVLKNIFPAWSYGSFLDAHGKTRAMFRRSATAANGIITVTASKEATVPMGSIFSTASVNDEPSVDYRTLHEVTIPKDESVQIAVECTQTGTIGNTKANTIVFVTSRLTGIVSVINEADVTGGTEEEDDDTFRNRIMEYDATQGDSFVGCVADYKRWALSVDGVGSVAVIPAQDDSGLVTLIITDMNGDPATVDLCNDVYNYIISPDAPFERKTVPNSSLLVKAPDTMPIGVKATVELVSGADITAVTVLLKERIALYLADAISDGEVKLTQIGRVLSGITGVNDYKDLVIGAKIDGSISYGTTNIPITKSQLPVVNEADLILTVGTVV